MGYIKDEIHFINFCCKKIRDFGLAFENHERLIEDLKGIYQLSEEIRHLTFGKTLVDTISWQLYQKTNKEEIIDFFCDGIKEIVIEALDICRKNLDRDFKFLNPIKTEEIIKYNEIKYNKFPNKISEEAISELIGLENCYGIYFIYNDKDQLIYIGKSKNLKERIPSSLKERKGRKFAYILTKKPADIHILEPYLILKYKPLKNTEFMEYGDASFNLEAPPMSKIINFYEEKEE